jgi:H+/gluconate symporter-like permease
MSEIKIKDTASDLLGDVEEQVGDLLKTIEEQDAQVWAYLIGGVIALLVGLIAAYFYAKSVREKRKSKLERVMKAVRGGIGL